MPAAPIGLSMTVKLSRRTKELFFDRAAVKRRIGQKTAKAMGRAGAFIQRRSASSMKRRNTYSQPGKPPSAHSTDHDRSLKKILFFYEPRRQQEIIGPVGLGRISDISQTFTVPELMEFGGTVVLRRPRSVFDSAKRGAKRTVLPAGTALKYEPRPFMQPALDAEIAAGKIAGLWGNVLRD